MKPSLGIMLVCLSLLMPLRAEDVPFKVTIEGEKTYSLAEPILLKVTLSNEGERKIHMHPFIEPVRANFAIWVTKILLDSEGNEVEKALLVSAVTLHTPDREEYWIMDPGVTKKMPLSIDKEIYETGTYEVYISYNKYLTFVEGEEYEIGNNPHWKSNTLRLQVIDDGKEPKVERRDPAEGMVIPVSGRE